MPTPSHELVRTTLGTTGRRVFPLGLAATYRPGDRAVRRALDEGVNYLFAFGIDRQMNRVIRGMTADQREKVVIATVGYTATRWTYLLRRPKGWPPDCPVATAGQCYRFVLSNPRVHEHAGWFMGG